MGRGAELHGPVRVDVAGWLLALTLPLVLWHHTIGSVANAFHWELRYLITGWAPWLLMLGGLACFVPVIVDRVKDPQRRFYGSQRAAWFGWSITLYVLGFGLATQVAQITEGFSSI
jgi:heme/copper-type cytochrome/quinol oxidase subunit 1